MENDTQTTSGDESKDSKNLMIIAGGTIAAIAVLSIGTFAAVQYAKKQSGTTVLPGGVTYLGPTPTAAPAVQGAQDKGPDFYIFTTDPTVKWKEFKGKKYPYSFSYPETLPLVVFPNDPLDAAAISWNNVPPQQSILLNVDNITNNEKMKQYAKTQSKQAYVDNWWKQFSGLKGVSSIKSFVNAKGLQGYRTRFINTAGQTPNEDVFLEIPGRPELVIRLGNGVLDQPVFDRVVDSVSWNDTTTKPVVSSVPQQ